MGINLYDRVGDRRTGETVGFVADTYDEQVFGGLGYYIIQTGNTLAEAFDSMGGVPCDMLISNYGEVYAVCDRDHTVPFTMTQDNVLNALPFHHDEWR